MSISASNISFRANLIISGNKHLLSNNERDALTRYAQGIGQPDDIIEANIGSDILDFTEVNENNRPTKIMSGYKLTLDSTVDGAYNTDLSAAKRQQDFFVQYETFKPYTVIKDWLTNICSAEKIKDLQQAINDNPALYNQENSQWTQNSRFTVAEPVLKPITKHFYNSPMYKAICCDGDASPKRIVIIDVFKTDGVTLANSYKYDTPHGSFVRAIVNQLTQNNDVEIETYNVKAMKEHPCSFEPKSFLKVLKQVSKSKPDYLNLSVFYRAGYTLNGNSFDPSELCKLSDEIRKNLPERTKHILDEIEHLIQNGCEVYIAGGNKKDKFNILSLAKGAHIIGGIDINQLRNFTQNSIIERYEKLPVYISRNKDISSEVLTIDYPFERDLTSLPKTKLKKLIANEDDYIKLETLVRELSNNGELKFDKNMLGYALVSKLSPNQQCILYDLQKYLRIFEGMFDEDILKNVFPQGTHCDVRFEQFFDMKSKSRYIIPRSKTTKLLQAISGTSFATPQALVKDFQLDTHAQELFARDKQLWKSLLRFI